MYWGVLSLLVVVLTAVALMRQRDLLPVTKESSVRALDVGSGKFIGILLAVFGVIALFLIFNPDLGYFWETGDIAPAS
jgi:hypothetical protein